MWLRGHVKATEAKSPCFVLWSIHISVFFSWKYRSLLNDYFMPQLKIIFLKSNQTCFTLSNTNIRPTLLPVAINSLFLAWGISQPSFVTSTGSFSFLIAVFYDRISDKELRELVGNWSDERWKEYQPLLQYCRNNGVRLMAGGAPLEVFSLLDPSFTLHVNSLFWVVILFFIFQCCNA